ncbi:hypothetical protein ACOSQ2_029329 [Xanthoceras sorbifolium]
MCWLSTVISRDDMGLFCVILWCLWWDRNCFCHSKKQVKQAGDLIVWAARFLKEFQSISQALKPSSSSCLNSANLQSQVAWIPLPSGCLKLNSDAAVKSGVKHVGLGGTIRNDKGAVVAAFAKPLVGVFGAEVGELLAVREGLMLGKNLGLKVDWVEIDAVNVAAAINSPSLVDGVAGGIFFDVNALCREVGVSKCHAISRSWNGVAHTLASLAFSSVEEQVWLDVEPVCVAGLL